MMKLVKVKLYPREEMITEFTFTSDYPCSVDFIKWKIISSKHYYGIGGRIDIMPSILEGNIYVTVAAYKIFNWVDNDVQVRCFVFDDGGELVVRDVHYVNQKEIKVYMGLA